MVRQEPDTQGFTTRVAVCCDTVLPQVGADTAAAVRQVRHRLDAPVCLAVAGRLNAGKSTLVNALVGRRVAPTAPVECTRLVTRYRYGTTDRVEVVDRAGARTAVPVDDDTLVPQRVPVPWAQVAYLDVTVTSDRLRQVTVVDTPGLASTDRAVSDTARRWLHGAVDADSAAAVDAADAVLHVLTQAVRADDVAALAAAGDPLTAVGILSKIDTLVGAGEDPWPVAQALAGQQARLLAHVVADVVPAVGLLAETTRTGGLTAADVAALRALATLPAGQRLLLTASTDWFTGRDAPVPADVRHRLLRLLDLHGVGLAVTWLAADPDVDSATLIERLAWASGLRQVEHRVDEVVRQRADVIKAGRAVEALQQLAGRATDPTDRAVLTDAVEELLAEPRQHRLRLVQAARQVTTGRVGLPERMRRELTRLATSTDARWILDTGDVDTGDVDTDGLAAAAVAAAGRWRSFAVGAATPAQARVAHLTHRGFHLLAQQVRAGAGGT
ncbi:dynamin family protein [Micromonospora sp. CPCC 206060]|uniref:dynamin family protein n=1 Tax=Micromonospora sp. CPCC 206060 TaxID=3122406 RepID=UPI002FF35EDD